MSLFTRYRSFLIGMFLVVGLISVSLFSFQWHAAYAHELTIIEDKFVENTANLESLVKATTDHLNTLKVVAEDTLNFDVDAETIPSPLRPRLVAKDEQHYGLRIPEDYEKGNLADLQGMGNLKKLQKNLGYEREINMALRLNANFNSVFQNLSDATWTYYTSARDFLMLYPYSEEFELSPSMLEAAFFTGGQPTQNPNRETFWTPAYQDLVTGRLMVTAADPVYERDDFLGTVAIDITLKSLADVVDHFVYGDGALMISGSEQQLLAHPHLITTANDEIQSLAMALPEPLKLQVDAILNSPDSQLQSVGDFWVIHHQSAHAPWQFLCVVPKQSIYREIALSGLLVSAIPLIGLLLCLWVTSQMLNSLFIRPAFNLVEQINQESKGVPQPLPANLPQVWQAPFHKISEAFQENRALLQESKDQLETLKSAQLQLVKSEKMSALGNLVAGVAHEINNPIGFLNGSLTNAKTYLQELLEHLALYQQHYPQPVEPVSDNAEDIELDFIVDDFPKLLVSMEGANQRIKSISTSLRTFSRADTEHKVSANLHEGLDSTLLILKYRLKGNEKRPAIEVFQDYGDLPIVECFPGRLNQVFMNLLANAIDVFDEGAQEHSFDELKETPQSIIVTTRVVDQAFVEIRIRDNGKGMTDAVQERIFDHLFTTKDVGKGTGLGLAIAQQIITEAHGGTIDVASELGAGTEFCIRLPL